MHDGIQLAAEYKISSGTLVRRYVFGPGVDEPLVEYDDAGTSQSRFLSTDERGSVIALTDSSGALVAIDSYDEYGNPGSANQGRFQYTGQAWLPEIGLYYYKARFYAPHLGRFLQTDPIGYGDSPNLYNYVRGDPINSADSSGTIRSICTGAKTCETGGDWFDSGAFFLQSRLRALGEGTSGVAGVSCSIVEGGSSGGSGPDDPVIVTVQRACTTTFSSDPALVVFAQPIGPTFFVAQQSTKVNRGCGTHSDLADSALYVFNFAGTAADAASLGLAAASAATGGPLDPVGASLGFGAIVANRVSAATSALAIPINVYQGNYRGAVANVAGLIAGHFAADLAGKALGAPISGIKKDATNTAASQAVSNGSGC
jgi:RHS repeat-associated protein